MLHALILDTTISYIATYFSVQSKMPHIRAKTGYGHSE